MIQCNNRYCINEDDGMCTRGNVRLSMTGDGKVTAVNVKLVCLEFDREGYKYAETMQAVRVAAVGAKPVPGADETEDQPVQQDTKSSDTEEGLPHQGPGQPDSRETKEDQ